MVEPPDHRADVGSERDRVPHEHPQDRDDAERDRRLHHGAEHVLGPHEPAVEQGEPRRHEHHERRRGEHPRGVSAVAPIAFLLRSRLEVLSALGERKA